MFLFRWVFLLVRRPMMTTMVTIEDLGGGEDDVGVLLVDPVGALGRMMCKGAIGTDGIKFCTKGME
jgi:hypothetical protein